MGWFDPKCPECKIKMIKTFRSAGLKEKAKGLGLGAVAFLGKAIFGIPAAPFAMNADRQKKKSRNLVL